MKILNSDQYEVYKREHGLDIGHRKCYSCEYDKESHKFIKTPEDDITRVSRYHVIQFYINVNGENIITQTFFVYYPPNQPAVFVLFEYKEDIDHDHALYYATQSSTTDTSFDMIEFHRYLVTSDFSERIDTEDHQTQFQQIL